MSKTVTTYRLYRDDTNSRRIYIVRGRDVLVMELDLPTVSVNYVMELWKSSDKTLYQYYYSTRIKFCGFVLKYQWYMNNTSPIVKSSPIGGLIVEVISMAEFTSRAL